MGVRRAHEMSHPLGMLCSMEKRMHYERWVNREKARYYEARLCQDLFGEWILLTVWGGCGSSRGRLRSTGVASYAAGLDELREIGGRRRAHGYDRAACVRAAPE
jgi:hypothetical protein